MSTQYQRQTYIDMIQSGQAATQCQAIELYLSRAGMASTKQIAIFLDHRPMSTATARLNALAEQGKVIKVETEAGRTGWKWVKGEEERRDAIRRHRLERTRRDIDRLIRRDEMGVLPRRLINWLKLVGNEVERTI